MVEHMDPKNTIKNAPFVYETDAAIALIIARERARQEGELNLIASENYAPQAVMHAMGSVLTNKYAEGYPGKRYYGGCSVVDEAERLAIERAQQLFGAEHVNVQPHSGSSANMAVYHTLLQPGDTILGMQLAEGGHLTHGHTVNFSGKLYNAVSYGVNRQTGLLDYDVIEQLAVTHKPKLIIAGASAYSKTIDFERFAAIAKKVNAYFMADIAHIAGLVATGLHPSPFPHADFVTTTTHKTLRGPRGGMIMCKKEYAAALDKTIMPGLQGGPLMHTIAAKAVAFGLALKPEFTNYQKQVLANARTMSDTLQSHGFTLVSGGTDTHLFIVDVRSKNITGKQAEMILDSIGITVNRNCIPGEQEKPWITSGIRIGTPSITTRGMKENQAQEIADIIAQALSTHCDESMKIRLHNRVKALCAQFPIYP